MKSNIKQYILDVLCFGLSVAFANTLYILLIEVFKGGLDNSSFNIIDFVMYFSIIASFIIPFIFGIIFSQKLTKFSIASYLTVFVIMLFVDIVHITMPDSYFLFLMIIENLIVGLFEYNPVTEIIIAIGVPVLFTLSYFLGAFIKTKKSSE